jgi:hypothetical protein
VEEVVRVSSFGAKNKVLAIDADTIRFGEKTIRREEITAIRYWIEAIVFYRFAVGRQYYLGFRTPTDQLDITLTSYLGIGNDYFAGLCDQVMAEVWEPVTDAIWQKTIDTLRAGGVVPVGTCQVRRDGILITQDRLLSKEQNLISWAGLHYEKKYDRLVLNSTSDQAVWTNLYFRDTWNIHILMTLLDWISQEDGLAALQPGQPS